ncbi:MAG: hypothetical protein ACKOVH_01230, partial [Actinomycetota bacterium]
HRPEPHSNPPTRTDPNPEVPVARMIPADMVETVTRVLLGSIDTGDGGSAEQRHELTSIV